MGVKLGKKGGRWVKNVFPHSTQSGSDLHQVREGPSTPRWAGLQGWRGAVVRIDYRGHQAGTESVGFFKYGRMRSSHCVYGEKGLFLEIPRGVDRGKGLFGKGLEGIRDKGYKCNMRVLECWAQKKNYEC